MKFPKGHQYIYGFYGLLQLTLFIIGLVTHDWFWLAAAFVAGANLFRVINYEGDEE